MHTMNDLRPNKMIERNPQIRNIHIVEECAYFAIEGMDIKRIKNARVVAEHDFSWVSD